MASLTRRNFFGAILAAIASPYLVSKITDRLQNKPVQAYLIEAWNAYTKGKHGSMPNTVIVSQELFNAYESELTPIYRFEPATDGPKDGPQLKFKCITMRPSNKLRNWDYIFV